MKLRDMNIGDIMYISCQLRDDEWDQIVAFGGQRDIDALVIKCINAAKAGPAWAFVDDETNDQRALVIGGYIKMREGVYSSWFLASKSAWGLYGRQVTEMAVERHAFMFKTGAHRIETLCLASRKLAQRWYQTIGLKFESTLEGYCADGSDAVMYVAVKGKL